MFNFTILYLLLSFSAGVDTVIVVVPDTLGETGETISLPLYILNNPGNAVYSYQFDAVYDSTKIESMGATTTLTISSLWGSPVVNTRKNGIVRIAHAGAFPLQGKGILIYLSFFIKTEQKDKCSIVIKNFMFNEGLPASQVRNGSINIIKK